MNSSRLSTRATIVLLLSAVLPLIDSSLINVLLPSIGADLAVEEASAQLGVSSYMLAATVGIVLSATCIRRWGARTVWFAAVITFAIASTLVGLSSTLPVFVFSRVAQGAACGFIMPAVQQLVVELVGRENMRTALATIGLPAVVAPAAGPLLGGVLVDLVGWRALFLVNIPLVVFAVACAGRALPRTEGQRESFRGLYQVPPALAGLVGILWALSSIGMKPGGTIWMTMCASLAALALFCVMDLRSQAPLLDVSMYHSSTFSAVMALCLSIGAIFYGTLLSTSLHIQMELGQPAWMAGVLLGIQGAGAWSARNLIKGRWNAVGAFGLIGAGLLFTAIGTVGIHSLHSWSEFSLIGALICSVLRGLGLGACTLLALSAAYEVVPDEKTTNAGSHTRLMLQLGGTAGTALVGVWSGSAMSLGIVVALVAAASTAGAWILHLRLERSH